MNQYWQNLRPLEKRLVVGVGSVLFILLNWWFVVPHFSDLSKIDRRMKKAGTTLQVFNSELSKTNFYAKEIARLQGEGLSVPQEEQMFNFSSAVNVQAAQSGVAISSSGKIQSDTNQFFVELSQNVTVVSKEQNLVDFLYNLGSGNSLIRVRDLGLRPDPPRQQLISSIKLVASYQRKLPARGVTPARTAAPAAAPKKEEPAKTKPAEPEKKVEPAKTTPKAPELPKTATNSPANRKFGPPKK
jgi:Type II secretion system (T2SS), protein M